MSLKGTRKEPTFWKRLPPLRKMVTIDILTTKKVLLFQSSIVSIQSTGVRYLSGLQRGSRRDCRVLLARDTKSRGAAGMTWLGAKGKRVPGSHVCAPHLHVSCPPGKSETNRRRSLPSPCKDQEAQTVLCRLIFHLWSLILIQSPLTLTDEQEQIGLSPRRVVNSLQ